MTDVTHYLDELRKYYATGQALEHAYRPALKDLFEGIEPGLVAVNDPKHRAAGAPDFIILRGEIPIGFAEAKDVDVNLDKIEHDEQLDRYRKALGNLILTNYLEFRRYQEGEHRETVVLAEVHGGKIQARDGEADNLERLLFQFAQTVAPTISRPKELASRMAAMTREIGRLIGNLLTADVPSPQLLAQLEDFQQMLIPDLTPHQFADMYAQTLAYGLFAARVHGGDAPFTRQSAGALIPRTNPFLRKLFNLIAGPVAEDELVQPVLWLMDSLAGLLNHADMGEILRNFGTATRQQDPIVHFYETFLSAYDPALRERRGVYYTPEPVVSYIVNSVDSILKTTFNRAEGLADPQTFILDPAAGTGTFLYFAIRSIYDGLMAQGQAGTWDTYVSKHLLSRLFGFELLMAPYAMAHMKLGIELQNTGYTFSGDQRLGIYLTNTLDEAVKTSERLGFAGFISEEGHAAAEVKRDQPIMVVLGNPPYSGISANKGDWIEGLLQGRLPDGSVVSSYYEVDGQPLGEKKVWLKDDYVKFIRFGQWRIERTGGGVLAFVTNHGYLDNPTFRGMRQSLLNSFTDIYLIDLHGSSKKGEKAPSGSANENVFDIQLGVAIGIFVKEPGKEGLAKIHHTELWGTRAEKYEWLLDHHVNNTVFEDVEPARPNYYFVPQKETGKSEYLSCTSLLEIFQDNVSGIITAQDNLVLDYTDQALKHRLSALIDKDLSDEDAVVKLHLTGNFAKRIAESRRQLQEVGIEDNYLRTILYRPFDFRRIFYHSSLVWRTREDVMTNMLETNNIAMIVTRQTRDQWDVLATNQLAGHKSVAAYDVNNLFPLYVTSHSTQRALFELDSGYPSVGRRPNLDLSFIKNLEHRLGLTFVYDGRGDLASTFGPEDVFFYIYAIFHSPTYRFRYGEFLRKEFPRVPLTSDPELFAGLAAKGAELVDHHLMRGVLLQTKLITKFPVKGGNQVEKRFLRYAEPSEIVPGRVWINETQYFEDITPEVWQFHIGGYQVLEKWLKDRQGRELSFEDIMHYQRIVVALTETMRLMAEIDALIPGWPLA